MRKKQYAAQFFFNCDVQFTTTVALHFWRRQVRTAGGTDKRHYSLKCAGQAALWSAATCRSFRALRGFVSECGRQAAADQSGARRGPRRGSRAGVLTPPHSRKLTLRFCLNTSAILSHTPSRVGYYTRCAVTPAEENVACLLMHGL
jgi:hypothetical protein